MSEYVCVVKQGSYRARQRADVAASVALVCVERAMAQQLIHGFHCCVEPLRGHYPSAGQLISTTVSPTTGRITGVRADDLNSEIIIL